MSHRGIFNKTHLLSETSSSSLQLVPKPTSSQPYIGGVALKLRSLRLDPLTEPNEVAWAAPGGVGLGVARGLLTTLRER